MTTMTVLAWDGNRVIDATASCANPYGAWGMAANDLTARFGHHQWRILFTDVK